MKVLVTGANGYIGQGVVKELLNKNQEVIATDFELQHVDECAQKIETDIFEIEDPMNYFGNPDVIIHLAWRDGFKHASIHHMEDLPKHYEFLRKLAESGIGKICVLGSMHEVGFYEGSIDKDTPCFPQSLYGIAKNALRQAVELLANDFNFKYNWMRGYYIVGNSHFGCSIFSKITEAAEKGQEKFPFTLGQNQFDFIDYDIFCQQIVKTALQDVVEGIVECCSGKPEKLSDRVERFIKENGYSIELDYGAFPDRPYDSKAVWGNNTLIEGIMNR